MAAELSKVFADRIVPCIWSTSGQYELPQRILFYVLILFALFAHHHQWLAVGALGYAMTYSGAAAIHGIVLFIAYRKTGLDPDEPPIFAIVCGSLLLALPLLSWSMVVRKVAARRIVQFWFLFMGISTGILVFNQDQSLRWAPAKFSCNFTAPGCKGIQDVDFTLSTKNDLRAYFSRHMWEACQCQSKCNEAPMAGMFRKGSAAQVSVWLRKSTNERSPLTSWQRLSGVHTAVIYSVLGILVLIQFIICLFLGNATPVQLRQRFYTYILKTRYLPFLPLNGSFRCRRRRRSFAKWASFSIYIYSIFSLIVCPTTFCYMTIQTELVNDLQEIPNEPYNAVGQWTPWVQVVLVMCASLIQKYFVVWAGVWTRLYLRCKKLLIRLKSGSGQRVDDVQRKMDDTHERKHSLLEEIWRQTGKILKGGFRICSKPLTVAIDAWKDGKAWLRDPDGYVVVIEEVKGPTDGETGEMEQMKKNDASTVAIRSVDEV